MSTTENEQVFTQGPTPEELQEAAEQLKNLTPEGFWEIAKYIQSLEALDRQTTLPEAGGVAWRNLFDDEGSSINITARAASTEAALRAIMDATSVGFREYGLKTTPFPSAGQPQYVPDMIPDATQYAPAPLPVTQAQQPAQAAPPQGIEKFTVSTVQHVVSPKSGVHSILVKGGPWTKFGWPAYDQAIPSSVDWMNWPIGGVQQVPPEMKVALLNKEARKIVGFQSG